MYYDACVQEKVFEMSMDHKHLTKHPYINLVSIIHYRLQTTLSNSSNIYQVGLNTTCKHLLQMHIIEGWNTVCKLNPLQYRPNDN